MLPQTPQIDEKPFPWSRYFTSFGQTAPTDIDGFLQSHNTDGVPNSGLFAPTEVQRSRCVVILGPPGIGKTSLLESMATQEEHLGVHTVFIRFSAHSTLYSLRRAILESPKLRAWISSTARISIFLDGLDESFVRVDEIAEFLAETLPNYSLDRLSLRITCRTAAWPTVLESSLRSIWGPAKYAMYEVAPLSRADVEFAARRSGIDPPQFYAWVSAHSVLHLANQPLNLRLLLLAFREQSNTTSRSSLFLKACQQLLGLKREAWQDHDASLDMACQVAALLTFCRLGAVSFAEANGADVLTVKELASALKQFSRTNSNLTEASLSILLKSPLFRLEGTLVRFIHRGIQDFLAAYYLVRRDVSLNGALGLLTSSNIVQGRVFPELSETAAWYAGLNEKFFEHILRTDPQILLRSDAATAEPQQRSAIVTALLHLFDQNELTDRDWDLRSLYHRLNHPKIAEQLYPYISDRSKNLVVRRVAIDIAEQCQDGAPLWDLLVEVAIDSKDEIHTRIQAAQAVATVPDDRKRAKLAHLLQSDLKADVEDELRGYVLRSLWPSHLSAEQVFTSLIPPKRESFFGAYQNFIGQYLAENLRKSDLVTALNWVAKHEGFHQQAISIQSLAGQIMLKSALELHDPFIQHAFAIAAWRRLARYEELFETDEYSSTGRRLKEITFPRADVIATLVSNRPEEHRSFTSMYHLTPLLAGAEDIPWLLEQACSSSSPDERGAWAELAHVAVLMFPSQYLDDILEAAHRSPIITKEFEQIIQPVLLDSDIARQAQELWERGRELSRPNAPKRLDPPPVERVKTLLTRFEAGELDAWWKLNLEMTLEETSTHYGNEFEGDLTLLPVWINADELTKQRIVSAALKYLYESGPKGDEWLRENMFHRPAAAGYRALSLVHRCSRAEFERLPQGVWEKWAAVTLAFPLLGSGEADDEFWQIAQVAFANAPDEMLKAVLLVIDRENAQGSTLFVLRRLANCWSGPIAAALLQKLEDASLKASCWGEILSELLGRDVNEAFQYAFGIAASESREGVLDTQHRLKAVVALLAHGGRRGWEMAWPVIEHDAELGPAALTEFAHSAEQRLSGHISVELTDLELGRVFKVLMTYFPPGTDVDRSGEGAYLVSPRDSVTEFRNSLLRRLQERGTADSLLVLEQTVKEFPDSTWLKWALVEARKIAVERAWHPLTPQEFLGAFEKSA